MGYHAHLAVKTLESLLAEVRRVVERRGGTVVIERSPPAAPMRIERVAAFAATTLPPSLVGLWSLHDGLEVRVFGRDEAPGITTHPLIVRGSESTIAATQALRDFFAGMRESGNDDFTCAAASQYLEIIDTDDPDHHILADLARRAGSDGEAPLIEVSFYEDWLTEPPQPLAASAAEFLERSLRFMIETQGGFKYWCAPDTEW